ncbi:MAG: metallophosphoesterase [Methylocystis sp.]|uniref:metallophosphoesterase n=1 Tax=Methylocystis sp. TaxID=1911079 RepID=UPI003DA2BC16
MPYRCLESDEITARLEARLGIANARRRLAMETQRQSQARRETLTVLGVALPIPHRWIEGVLRLSGLYWIGRRNAARVRVLVNEIVSADLPAAFDGFTILHLSDLHADNSPRAMSSVADLLGDLDYDLCVWTGDYRGETFGDFRPCLRALFSLRARISTDVYAVLGNHDSIRMVPDIEAMGVRLLLNESVVIARGDARLSLAGVDDAHFHHAEDLASAARGVPVDAYAILLSHTPEIYSAAAQAGFDLLLGGHTHGGQICLPGGFALTLDAVLPRRMGRGAWKHETMSGYTSAGAGASIVPVRFNCPPEITLHRLLRG